MRRLSNFYGFAAIEAILIIVIISMVGFTGWFVWHSKQATDLALSNANKSAQSKSQTAQPSKNKKTASAVTYKFPEYGLQFILPSSLKGMTYLARPLPDELSTEQTVLYLDDPNLADIVNACNKNLTLETAKTINFAAITKMPGKYDAEKEIGESTLLKQFDAFHILVSYPNGTICASTDDSKVAEVTKAVQASQKAFVNAFKASATEIK